MTKKDCLKSNYILEEALVLFFKLLWKTFWWFFEKNLLSAFYPNKKGLSMEMLLFHQPEEQPHHHVYLGFGVLKS